MLTKQDIEKYFLAEKSGALIILLIGIGLIALAIFCRLYFKTTWSKGFLFTVIAISLIQIIVGAIVYQRADKQRLALVYAYDMNKSEITVTEKERIDKVEKNFTIFKYAEIFLMILGVTGIVIFRQNQAQQILYGISIGLLLQASICFVVDAIASKRAAVYSAQIKMFK